MDALIIFLRRACLFLSSSATYSKFSDKIPLCSPKPMMFMVNSPKVFLNLLRLVDKFWPLETFAITTSRIEAYPFLRVCSRIMTKDSRIGIPAFIKNESLFAKKVWSLIDKRVYDISLTRLHSALLFLFPFVFSTMYL